MPDTDAYRLLRFFHCETQEKTDRSLIEFPRASWNQSFSTSLRDWVIIPCIQGNKRDRYRSRNTIPKLKSEYQLGFFSLADARLQYRILAVLIDMRTIILLKRI